MSEQATKSQPNILSHQKMEVTRTPLNNAVIVVGWAFDDGSFNYDVITSMVPEFKTFCKSVGLDMNPDGEWDLSGAELAAVVATAKARLIAAEAMFNQQQGAE